MFDDEPIEPVEYPIDPENPPEFPGKLPRDFSTPLRDQLQQMMEAVSAYLGPEHRVINALLEASHEITAVTFPKLNGYAEYDPDRTL
ncbi:hypothetical protein K7711_08315 [Nocardia sp. CA2R105]|uniref:hypothetical protein n=1 Tax=Nocardia coffeae TaxID=2873381 RepID=UPI001CA728F0|nr:hypothetical protein [Nocardia coffeae]MBY8856477.1 hypothetical protein [Nocardia coffeae]